MIVFLQLPFHFEVKSMHQEFMQMTQEWKRHYNEAGYSGDWSAIALRSPGGKMEDLQAESLTGENFAATPLLDLCPSVAKALHTFDCELNSVRLLRLAPGAVIHEHRDIGLNYESGEARIHVPVVTHEGIEFYCDGHRIPMREGECWYLNANLPHRVSNPGPGDRIHLVIDCVVNDWIKNLFEGPSVLTRQLKDTSVEDKIHLQKVLQEMENLPGISPAVIDMVRQQIQALK